jgi:hypothetical protein
MGADLAFPALMTLAMALAMADASPRDAGLASVASDLVSTTAQAGAAPQRDHWPADPGLDSTFGAHP